MIIDKVKRLQQRDHCPSSLHQIVTSMHFFVLHLMFFFLTMMTSWWLCCLHLCFVRDIFPSHIKLFVQNDAVAALASGTMGRLHGCVLIAGTGTIAYGFTEDGREARAAGAGPILGDWGRWVFHLWEYWHGTSLRGFCTSYLQVMKFCAGFHSLYSRKDFMWILAIIGCFIII